MFHIRLLRLLLAPLTLSFAAAQVQTPLRIDQTGAPSSYRLRWDSSSNRSYFLQQSPDLSRWTYLPKVLKGLGREDVLPLSSTDEKAFFRLVWSSIPITDPLTADHDGDGIPSYAELTVTNTDPLKWSTTGSTKTSDRGTFPNPTGGVYVDRANNVQYIIVPNSPGTTGSPRIVPSRFFETPDYAIEYKTGTLNLEKKGYPEFASSTTPSPSTKRYLTRQKNIFIRDRDRPGRIAPPWEVGVTYSNPIRRINIYNSNDTETLKINPLTGAETYTPPPAGNAGALNNYRNKDDSYLFWGDKTPTWRWISLGNPYPAMYAVAPFYYPWGWTGYCYVYYEDSLTDENTFPRMLATAQANRPAYAKNWTEGNPWARWDHWTNEFGLTYTRARFRIRNRNGVATGEPVRIYVHFAPENGGPREQVMSVQWDGKGTYSPEYEIDPATLKPGSEGTYHINAGSMFFELDLAQTTNRQAGKTVLIPVPDDQAQGSALMMSIPRQIQAASTNPPNVTPDIKFPGMDDNWYEGATIMITKTDGAGSVSLRAVNQLTGHEVVVPFGHNLASNFFHSQGAYSNYVWSIRGVDAGDITLRLTYVKGSTILTLDRSGCVTPKINLYPEIVPLDGLTRAKMRISNLGTTAVPVLASNQMPIINIGGIPAANVRQDELDPTTFYFTPPTAAIQGTAPVKISDITIGGFTFPTTTSLDAHDGFIYTDDLQQGLASFSSSIGVSIAEARSSALNAKSGGMSSDSAFELMTSQIGNLTNEEMSRVKNFSHGKTMTSAASQELDTMVASNNFLLEQAASEIYGGISVPVSTGGPSALAMTPALGSATFFSDARQWMADHGTKIYTGSFGSYAHFAVIEANEFDLTTWTTATTNNNIYSAMAANPKAKILINGALFNFKAETFITTGIVYNDGVKLATSTDPSQGSFAVANLRYWFGQTMDNSMSANGSTAATYQFGGKGHPPVPPATPGPADVHSAIGGMISCIWPDAAGNGQKVTPAQDSDLKVYAAMGRGSMLGYGMIGVDRHTGMMIILSKENGYTTRLNLFDVQNALWSSGVDQAVVTDGGSSVALAINGSIPVKGARHYGSSAARDTVTNYFAFTPIPVVKITAPASGVAAHVGTSVTVTAMAKGGTGNVTKVEFYQGAMKIGEDSSEPYSITFIPNTAGNSILSAKVFDDDGGNAKSIDIPITVNP